MASGGKFENFQDSTLLARTSSTIFIGFVLIFHPRELPPLPVYSKNSKKPGITITFTLKNTETWCCKIKHVVRPKVPSCEYSMEILYIVLHKFTLHLHFVCVTSCVTVCNIELDLSYFYHESMSH